MTKQVNRQHYFALLLIVLISFIVYLPVFHNGFLLWDDDQYIQTNSLIRVINLKWIFSSYVMGNYHPLTMLAYSIEYHFFGLNAIGYHAVNLMIHLLNVILVFRVVFLLSNKTEVALVASLLFGIHPMHVESVAWASELKDLLYVFFFLASYIYYLQYINLRITNQYEYTNKASPIRNKFVIRRYYFYCLLLFLLSLLSKAMAVSLPFVLLLTDYFKGRKINPARAGLEKAPFFAFALLFGVLALFAQRSASAIHLDFFTIPQRIVFASYNFITYIIKLLLPLHLCPFYSYPIKTGDSIPIQYYGYLFVFFGLAAYVIYTLRFTKKIFFGLCFFAITVFLVLQLLPVGGTIMADRYSYLPSVGVFYLAGEGLAFLQRRWKMEAGSGKPYFHLPSSISHLLLGVALIFYSVKTYSQCGIWKNTMIFWDEVIRQDQTIPEAYYNRGVYWASENKDEKALNDYNKAIQLRPDYADAYNNRGFYFEKIKKYEEALEDYNKAIQFNPDYYKSYANRAQVLTNLNRYNEALADFNKVIALRPRFAEAYGVRGRFFEGEKRYDEALGDLNKAIELDNNLAEAYSDRGTYFLKNTKLYAKALEDLSKAIELKPDYAVAYNNRGDVLSTLNRPDEAIRDYTKAITLDPDLSMSYNNRGNIYRELGRNNDALRDFNQAIRLNSDFFEAYNRRGLVFRSLMQYEEALNNFSKAIAINPGYVEAYNNRGIVFNDLKRYKEAIDDYTKAITLDPDYARAYNNLGSAFNALKRYEEAFNAFKKAILLNPEYADAYNNRGTVLLNEGKYAEAYNDFNKAIELQPASAEAYYNRGASEYDLGKDDQACSDFQHAIALGHPKAVATYADVCH